MRVVTQQVFGGPEALEVIEVDPPAPLPTEVLVGPSVRNVSPAATGRPGGR